MMQQKQYSILSKLTLVTLIFSMTACSSLAPNWPLQWKKPPPEIITVIKPVPVEIPQPILPRGLNLKEPYWYVVSNKNIDEFLKKMEKTNGGQVVFFAMSVDDYEVMAGNMQELRRYIRELKEVVVYYRTVTVVETNETED